MVVSLLQRTEQDHVSINNDLDQFLGTANIIVVFTAFYIFNRLPKRRVLFVCTFFYAVEQLRLHLRSPLLGQSGSTKVQIFKKLIGHPVPQLYQQSSRKEFIFVPGGDFANFYTKSSTCRWIQFFSYQLLKTHTQISSYSSSTLGLDQMRWQSIPCFI